MIVSVANNIFSPLGATSAANYLAVKAGRSALRPYDGRFGLPEAFTASLFPDDGYLIDGYTHFESALIRSITEALTQTDINVRSMRTRFVFSTTKGNVALLDPDVMPRIPRERILLGAAAKAVMRRFGNPGEPLVVSNACISGVCAQIAAMRLLDSNQADNVIVAGCDIQSRFIISGFQSFKALSQDECRPFDANRRGLNLGEAAATIIYTKKTKVTDNEWVAVDGAIRNDANHISGPSRTGEGSLRALRAAIGNTPADDIAFINAHGTATLYNDEMESIAIDRAGLASRPVNALKGYYGHTMGAAGVLETVISMHAVDDGVIPATRGFHTIGVSRELNISAENRATDKRAFVKLLSGFGGCNAALLMEKGGQR